MLGGQGGTGAKGRRLREMARRGKHVAPRPKGRGLRRVGRAIPLALAFVLAMSAVAFADNLEDTLVAGGSGTTISMEEGEAFSTTISYEVAKTGANNTTFPATVNFSLQAVGASSVPSWASLSASSLTFSGWDAAQTLTVSGTAPTGSAGTYEFRLEPSSSASNLNVTTGRVQFSITVMEPSTPTDTEDPQNASITINDGDTWTNSASVSLDFSATDNVGITRYRLAESSAGLASAADVAVSPAEASLSRTDQSFTLTGLDGAAKEVWLQVFDAAGNSATASDSIGLDRVAPTVTCNAASFLLNQPNAEVTATITDELSGPLNATESAAADTSAAGTGLTVSITGQDNAGNSASANCSYSVGYNFDGLYAPVDRPSTLNVSKAGQAIPLKWRLTDFFGVGVTDLSAVSVTAASLSCSLGTTADALEEYASGSSGLQNQGDGYYQFNWKTPTTYASSCKSLSIKMGTAASNAPVHSNLANFQFKK